jgi:glycine dehydrogenase subunit 2
MRRYHQAVYDEPLIFQMGHKGERGQLVPKVEEEIQAAVGDVVSRIPAKMRRKQPPALPEISEPEVVRHYLRMSQQTIGELGFQIGHGTSTVKYNPKINEQLARMPSLTNIHPHVKMRKLFKEYLRFYTKYLDGSVRSPDLMNLLFSLQVADMANSFVPLS